MSADLKDLRAKITPETWCWLEALHRATGKEQSEIVRDVLHDWASKHLDASSIAGRLLYGEGLAGKNGERRGRHG